MKKMKVEVWSDIMCPFCYIGKRHYEEALAKFTESKNIELVWKSYQLDPDVPEENVQLNSVEYLSERKGLPLEQIKQMHQSITEMAKTVGLYYDFENSKVANSFKAHRIIQFAKTKKLGDQAEELFFKAHFVEGKNLNDERALFEIANEIGLTKEETEEALNNNQYQQLVETDIVEASHIGVRGVPFFVFDRKYAISGAQPVGVFLQTMEQSFAEWRKENPENNFKIIEGENSCDIDGNCD